jgi:hypothetical protein
VRNGGAPGNAVVRERCNGEERGGLPRGIGAGVPIDLCSDGATGGAPGKPRGVTHHPLLRSRAVDG